MSEVQLILEGLHVAVGFDLLEGLDDQLFERIQTGLPSGFTYEFVLAIDPKRWFDNKVDSSQLQVVAMYNALSQEYLVNYKQDGKLIDSRIARDRDELERAMTHFENLQVFVLGDVSPKRRLHVRARADLGPRTFLLIIPTRSQTDWVTSRKFRAPPR